QAARLNLGEHVRFLGYRDDVPDLIKACDLFVFPSHMEGLGSSLIDAMLAERPIVTTTAGGIPDVIGCRSPGDVPVGWVVPPRDPQALASAIISAISSPMQREMLGQLARQRAEEH